MAMTTDDVISNLSSVGDPSLIPNTSNLSIGLEGSIAEVSSFGSMPPLIVGASTRLNIMLGVTLDGKLIVIN